jgi:precorrin-2 dehydrogenase/sirohydrochlorin ferrochelatase
MASTADGYPVVLDLRGRACLVVGGGAVAEAKVKSLLRAGAVLTVVSPTLTEGLAALARAGRIAHVARPYERQDLDGQWLAFVATGDRSVTNAVREDAQAARVWVNAADDPVYCDFLLPSVLRRGRLVVAVGSSGGSPGLARAIREELEAHFPEDYALLLDLAAEVRRGFRGRPGAPAGDAWRGALDPEIRRLLADGRRGEAEALLRQRLGVTACR